MKKLLVLLFALTLVLAACGSKDSASPSSSPSGGSSAAPAKAATLKVGATAVPHAEILKFIQPKLKEQGVDLQIVEFNDYVQPNVQVNEKQLDANFFQHAPYLEQFNKDNNAKLVKVAGVHVEPMGAYSKKIKKIDELKDGATVIIPDDPTNSGRALALLEKNGLIKLKEGVGVTGTVRDITENKKNLKFKELEAAMLPRTVDEADLSVINTNFALDAKLVPTKDALLLEGKDSPYVNILVAREDNKDSDAMQKLAKALNTPEVKKFIEDTYKGEVVPAF
ncbi:MetQ/NlpA family ABC transporter substrate-binding protein [Paenibacillus aurantius]|uniref:Lipoprotein n=1 Tax=Paenibacillus aurantius TaxID=2918900 RepID=A0AA96RGY8_9BACL|nr:MetQ/NlpA family ABC transporter substrate-binding protein [Paenibacillus aurantius]WNQ10559.1 MetQ/NlpA family ABC transporter substrate-binding protein [Paenibacillus aurantius]